MICIRATLEPGEDGDGGDGYDYDICLPVFILSWLLWATKLLLAKSVLFFRPLSITDKIGKSWKVSSTSKILLLL